MVDMPQVGEKDFRIAFFNVINHISLYVNLQQSFTALSPD
jgi:hypothetical protein